MRVCEKCGHVTIDGTNCTWCNEPFEKPNDAPASEEEIIVGEGDDSDTSLESNEVVDSEAAAQDMSSEPRIEEGSSSLIEKTDEAASDQSSAVESDPSQENDVAVQAKSYKKTYIVLSSIAACLVLLVFGALLTAQTRTYVDVPAYTRGTGTFSVTMDNENPCYVGQGWGSCINVLINEYNASCANRRLSSAAHTLCSRYADMIDDMESKSGQYYNQYVASLGSWGHLTATEITEEVPAVTHQGLCIFGFIGECQ